MTVPATSDVAHMDSWADMLVERVKPKLTSPAGREYEWFVFNLARYIRSGDFKTVTELIEAAEQGDPMAHDALDLAFREMLDAGEMPSAALRDYHRRANAPPAKRGRYWHEDYRRNVGFMAMVRLTCQTFALPPTRNREQRRARRPCGCSVLAAALQRAGIDASESRLTNLWGQQGKLAILMVDAWQTAFLTSGVPK